MPEVEATISAATKVEKDTPTAVRIPVNKLGKAPGKITQRKICPLLAPSERALS